jgi:hypothetical protein
VTQQADYLAQWSLTIDAAWEYSSEFNAINTYLVGAAQAQAATISSFADLQVASYQRIASAAVASKSAQEAATAKAAASAASTVTPPPPPPPTPKKFTKYTYVSLGATHHQIYANYDDGSQSSAGVELHGFSGLTCSKCGYTKSKPKTTSKVKVVPAETSSSKTTYTAITAPKK